MSSVSSLTAAILSEREKQADIQTKLEDAKKRHVEFTKQQNKIAQLERDLAGLTESNKRIETKLAELTDIVSGAIQDPQIVEMELKVSRARLRNVHLTQEWTQRETRRMERLLALEREQQLLLQQNKELEEKLLAYEQQDLAQAQLTSECL